MHCITLHSDAQEGSEQHLTPELSRAAKRRRLERIVRPLMRHRSEDPTVVHGKPRAEAVILQFPRTDMAHNLLGTNA